MCPIVYCVLTSHVQTFHDTTSANGLLVIHSPSIRDNNTEIDLKEDEDLIQTSIHDNYWPPEETLVKDTWGSEKATPIETSDVILKGRSSECPYEETELSSIITNKNIQSVILLGFILMYQYLRLYSIWMIIIQI